MTQSDLNQMIESALSVLGYELVGVERKGRDGQALLRIYIDSPSGVTIADVEKASRQISAVLDVEDPISSSYQLEVSSPGLDRPLFVLAHFEKYVGREIKCRLRHGVAGRRHYRGVLQQVDGNTISLLIDNEEVVKLAFVEIEKANLVPEF